MSKQVVRKLLQRFGSSILQIILTISSDYLSVPACDALSFGY
jgi:hypothetical protein